MLLPIRAGLLPSAVFENLNLLLREVILACCAGRPIDKSVFLNGFWSAIQKNAPTRLKLQELINSIASNDAQLKFELYLLIHGTPSARLLLGCANIPIPDLSENIKEDIKNFSAHLFERTSKLAGVSNACGETVQDYYIRYSTDGPPGNGNVCGVCATETLAQRRVDILDENQWCAPFDHLLAKETYPQFGVDPRNLLPTCHTCNSKAKLAKDLLRTSKGGRRACFDPWIESAHGEIDLKIDFLDIVPHAAFKVISINPLIQEKIKTWNDVYRIKERVEGEFVSLREKLAEDLDLRCLRVFKDSIEEKARVKFMHVRLTPNNYWRSLLYSSLLLLPDQLLEQLRTLCHDGLDPNGDAAATYGI